MVGFSILSCRGEAEQDRFGLLKRQDHGRRAFERAVPVANFGHKCTSHQILAITIQDDGRERPLKGAWDGGGVTPTEDRGESVAIETAAHAAEAPARMRRGGAAAAWNAEAAGSAATERITAAAVRRDKRGAMLG